MVEEFQARRDVLVSGLNSIDGIRCPIPEGAFYAFPNIEQSGLTSAEFERRLLEEAGVSVLAGTSFGEHGEGYIRISFANSQANIVEAISRIADWVSGL